MSFFGFGTGAASQSGAQSVGTSLFAPQQKQQQQALALQHQAGGQLQLVTKAGGPATFSTKWDDLSPDTQRLLQQVEARILEYRDESQRLDQCARLYDASALKRSFDDEAATVRQLLGGLSVAIRTEQASLASLFASVKELLAATETAVRSFLILRHRFARTALLPGGAAQQPALETFYSGIPSLPSPYLSSAVSSFEARLAAYRARVEELERLQQPAAQGRDQLEHALPAVLHNVHTFFLHVAAQVESLHAHISAARGAHLAELRRRGDERDPFLEADRREEATRQTEENRRKAAQAALLAAQPQQPAAATAGLQQAQAAAQQPAAAAPSTGLSLFSTPATSAAAPSFFAPTAAATSSLFGTPAPSQAASGGSLFGGLATGGPSAASTTAPSFGTGGLFGAPTQTPGPSAAASPSIFGAPSSTPAFGAPAAAAAPATPAFGGAFGAATPTTPATAPAPAFGAPASGAAPAWSLQAPPTTATRPKPRAARRK